MRCQLCGARVTPDAPFRNRVLRHSKQAGHPLVSPQISQNARVTVHEIVAHSRTTGPVPSSSAVAERDKMSHFSDIQTRGITVEAVCL